MEISVKNLSLSIGEKKILNNISFSVDSNKFVGLIGPNGSGKSTLLKCIYRTLQPDVGEISFDGKNIKNMSLKESSLNISVVEQYTNYVFDFFVEDIVLLGRTPHKKLLEFNTTHDYEIMKKALNIVGLKNFEKRKFSTLSGGEKQRVILARAITQKTPCMILDEPTNHLDIKYQLQLMKIISDQQFTVLAAIHDLNIAALYCDKLIAIQNGKIIGEGSPTNLLTSKFINYLYGVNSEIRLNRKTGKINIIYLPMS